MSRPLDPWRKIFLLISVGGFVLVMVAVMVIGVYFQSTVNSLLLISKDDQAVERLVISFGSNKQYRLDQPALVDLSYSIKENIVKYDARDYRIKGDCRLLITHKGKDVKVKVAFDRWKQLAILKPYIPILFGGELSPSRGTPEYQVAIPIKPILDEFEGVAAGYDFKKCRTYATGL